MLKKLIKIINTEFANVLLFATINSTVPSQKNGNNNIENQHRDFPKRNAIVLFTKADGHKTWANWNYKE